MVLIQLLIKCIIESLNKFIIFNFNMSRPTRHLYVNPRGYVFYQYANGRRVPLSGDSRAELNRTITEIFRNDRGNLGDTEYDPEFSQRSSDPMIRQRARERITYFNQVWNALMSQGATPEGPPSETSSKSSKSGTSSKSPKSGATPEGPQPGATPEGPKSKPASKRSRSESTSENSRSKKRRIEDSRPGATPSGEFTERKIKQIVNEVIRQMDIKSSTKKKIVKNVTHWYEDRKQKPSETQIINKTVVVANKEAEKEVEKEAEKEAKKETEKTKQSTKEQIKQPSKTPTKQSAKQPTKKPKEKKKKDPTSGASVAYLPTYPRTYGYHNVSVAEISKLKTPTARETWFPQYSDVETAWTAQLTGKPYYWKPPPARDILKGKIYEATPGATPKVTSGATPETTTGETPSAYGYAKTLLNK